MVVAAGAGVDATAFCCVAGCALMCCLEVVSALGVVARFDFVELLVTLLLLLVAVEAALRVLARVRLLVRVSIVITSSTTSEAAAVRRVRRVDIALCELAGALRDSRQ